MAVAAAVVAVVHVMEVIGSGAGKAPLMVRKQWLYRAVPPEMGPCASQIRGHTRGLEIGELVAPAIPMAGRLTVPPLRQLSQRGRTLRQACPPITVAGNGGS